MRKEIWREYGRALVFEVAGLVLAAIVPPLGARRWGPRGFGEYALIYRALAVLQPPLLLGLGIALPRTLSRRREGSTTSDGQHRDTARELLLSALAVVWLVLALVAATLLALSGSWSRVLFGDPRHTKLVAALALMLIGSCHIGLVSGYLRGRFLMRRANTLMLWYVGVCPLAALLVTRSVASVLMLTAVLWLAGSLLALSPWRLRPVSPQRLLSHARELLRFGIRRVPGEFALFGLLAVPPILVAHAQNLSQAGYLAFSMSLVTLAGALFSPLTLVMLPFASEAIDTGEHDQVRDHINRLAVPVLVLSLTGLVALEVLAPFGVRLYLGARFAGATGIFRLVALATLPYVVFVSLRSTLDAYHHRAVSLRNANVAFLVFVILSIAGRGLRASAMSTAAAFVASMWCLGLLTVWEVHRAFYRRTDEARSGLETG